MKRQIVSLFRLRILIVAMMVVLFECQGLTNHPKTPEEHRAVASSEVVTLNNNCVFKYAGYANSEQIELLGCSYCPEQKCVFRQQLLEAECIAKCCPYPKLFLRSQSNRRVNDCLRLTLEGQRQVEWVQSDFVYPFLVVIIALLISILIILLVKTALFLLHENCWKNKENRRRSRWDNGDDETQEDQFQRERWLHY